MKKAEQREINEVAESVYAHAMDELTKEYGTWWKYDAPCFKLRSCKAYVYETESYYILQSYRTIVAVLEKQTNTVYDVLRTEYGFTRTSAQHIAKFSKDYASRGHVHTLTTRYISD